MRAPGELDLHLLGEGRHERLWEQLGVGEPLGHQRVPDAVAWGRLEPGTATTKGGALFPRLDS